MQQHKIKRSKRNSTSMRVHLTRLPCLGIHNGGFGFLPQSCQLMNEGGGPIVHHIHGQ